MKKIEKTLQQAQPPELAVDEFRRGLRRDLLTEIERRRAWRGRLAVGGLSAMAVGLAAALALFVLRPALPAQVHAALFHDPDAGAVAAHGDPLPQLLAEAGGSARADRAWLDQWYAGQAEPVRVKSVEAEKLFAVRRFQLTSGERVLVFTEVGDNPGVESATAMAAVRDF